MTILIPLVIISAGLTIAGHYLKPERPWVVYVFKPLTTILIILAALLPGTAMSEPNARLIGLGLLFSLCGDILLMLPGDGFLFGLAAFLGGLICYAIAFREGAQARGVVWALLVLILIGGIVLAYIWPGLRGMLRTAVGVYLVVMVSMVALAAGRAMGKPSAATLAAAAGALLFMASDSMLAINRFRRPFRLVHASVLGTYFAGQLLIALSLRGVEG